MKKKVIIMGAGGHSKVIADIVKKSGDKVLGFLDDSTEAPHIIGKISDCVKFPNAYFIIAIGSNNIRQKISATYPNIKYYTAIHPSAVISENAAVGEGTCVMANAVINASATIGKHCIINTHATVEHDNTIEDFVHISPGAVLCGTVKVGEGTHVGAGAVVRNNMSITADCMIGMGAAVTCNITKAGTYIGVPAKEKA